MVPLHKILEHPKGIPIAERLIKRNRTGSIKYEKDEEALPPTCCRHCQLTLQLDRITSSQCDTITGCLDLQNQIHKLLEPDIDSSVTTESRCQVMLPRFFSLSPTTQCNFVSLLHHHIHQLPPTLLEQFIATLKPHLYYENDWCAFLVQSLEMKMIKPTDTDITEMKTPISGDTLEKLKCVAFSFRTSSSSTESRHEVIHDTSRLAGITVSSVWDQEEHYSDIETPAISFTEDVVAAPNAHDDEEVVEVSCLPRKKRKLDTSDVEDHLVSSRSKKLKLDEEEPRLDLSPQLAPMSTQATEVTDISDDVLEAAQMTWQRWLEGKAADEKLFQALISLEQTQFTQVLNQVSNPPEALPGDAIPVLIKNLIESQSDVSYINAVTLLKLTALPKIAGMGLSTHRLLISALSSLLTALPHQTIDGLLCPLMQNPHFVSSQAVCRLVKDKMTEEQRNLFWRKMLDLEVNTAGEPFVWSEHTLAVVQTLVDKKVTLDSHGVEKLMGILSRSAADLTKSVKFGCFIKDLCTRYSKIMSPATTDLLDIALSHKSSLKNLLVKTVKKLA